FPGGNDNYLAITGAAHPFLSGAETFHTPSLGDEEFEIPPIPLDADPSLAVSDVVGHFDELGFSTQYGVQGLDMPVGMNHGLMEQGGGLLAGGLAMDLDHSMGTQYNANPPVTIDVPMSPGALMGHGSELSSQLGLSLGAAPILPPAAPSPEERLSTTPSPTSSLQEDEAEEFRRKVTPAFLGGALDTGRKQKPAKKQKKKKDPNEPQKPVSAYALFFRDTQAAIKGQNPNATFGEVSKIVASMWDSLGEEQKQVYKRKTEAAKKECGHSLAQWVCVTLHPVPGIGTQPYVAGPCPMDLKQAGLAGEGRGEDVEGAGSPKALAQQPVPSNLQQQPPPLQIKILPPPALQIQPVALQPEEASPERPSPEPQGSPEPVEMITADVVPEVWGPVGRGNLGDRLGAEGRDYSDQRGRCPPPPPLGACAQHRLGQRILQQRVRRQALQVRGQLCPCPPTRQIQILPPPALQIQPMALQPEEASPERPSPEPQGSPEPVEMITADVVPEVESPTQMDVELVSESPVALSPRPRCVRSGADLPPCLSWGRDLGTVPPASSCVVFHGRWDVFLAWLASRNSNSSSVVFVK
uniref:TOX high mobility group box family member 4 n=1 Tax=Pelodiscus sinensis TaxID=13735 RepID=K7FJA0_PELSI